MADVSSITERLFLAFPKRQTKAALVFGCGALSAMSAIHTAGLYHAGAFPKIFVSGGVFVKDTEGYADLKNLALGALKEAGVSPPDPAKCEAEYMKDILVASGVPEDAIVVEDKSENMGENIQKSLALGLEDAESITFVLLAINARRGLMRLRKERPFPKPIVTLASVYPLPGIDRTNWDWDQTANNPFFCPDASAVEPWTDYLEAIRKKGSSCGAIVEVVAEGTVTLTELAQREIKLRLQRQALRESAGAWKPEDHPELANGGAAWVRRIRSLDSRRLEELEQRRSGK